MNTRAISLGRIRDISIRLDYSWFLVFAFLTWSLATGYFPFELGGASPAVYWFMGAATAILLFGSVLLHELGHSVVALRYKIPVRSITLFLFGGVAEIGREPPTPSSEFFIAIAGPIVSFGLAVFFWALETVTASLAPLFVLCKYLALINGSLALFNLIPGFPLDGGRIFRSIVWGISNNLTRATQVAANLGRVIAFLFIAWGIWQAFAGDLDGLWFAFIGWYLAGAASSQLAQHKIQSVLAGHPISEAMNPSYILADSEMPLQDLVNQNGAGYWPRAFVRQSDGSIVGLLSWREINAIPRDRWSVTTVRQAMVPLGRLRLVGPDETLQSAADEIAREGNRSLPVVSNGRILGTIGREELSWFIRRLETQRA